MADIETPTTVADLTPKMQVQGVIKRVEMTGALIDLGFEYDAILLAGQLPQRNEGLRETLQEGQAVTVWIRAVDDEHRVIDVTMIRPPMVDWSDLAVGQTHSGKVIRLKKFGAFIDIGAERPGLVHISEMSHDYVQKPQDLVQRGDDVQVKIIGLDVEKKQIDLSMKALDAVRVEPTREVEPQEAAPTAMALAWQKALAKGGANDSAASQAKSRRSSGKDREEILRRTLEQHEK